MTLRARSQVAFTGRWLVYGSDTALVVLDLDTQREAMRHTIGAPLTGLMVTPHHVVWTDGEHLWHVPLGATQ
jgi:hypothetical protein